LLQLMWGCMAVKQVLEFKGIVRRDVDINISTNNRNELSMVMLRMNAINDWIADGLENEI